MSSILVYHTISAQPEALPGDIDITPQKFEQQMRWLSRWRRVVSLTETLKENQNSVAITFDDGYRDNLTVALPLLEELEFPMTLFVTAGFVDSDGYLSDEELNKIARHPLVTIGAHGLSHRHFTRMDLDDARFEMIESRRLLQEITGQEINLMAWPFGECNDRLESLSKECGYRAAWSVWQGTNSTHSRWRVPMGRRDTLPRFIAKAAGAYALTKAKWHRLSNGRNGASLPGSVLEVRA